MATRTTVNLQSMARVHTETCIRTLAGIAAKGESEAARVSAATQLLDRGWGRAAQTLSVDGDASIQVVIRHIIEGRDAPRVVDAKPLPIGKDDDP